MSRPHTTSDDDYFTIRIPTPATCVRRCLLVVRRCRVRFTLVETLLVFLVLAPVLAVWNLTGTGGTIFLFIWVLIGVSCYLGAKRVQHRVWRVIGAFVGCLFCGLVIAATDGSLAAPEPTRVMFHLMAGGLIGTACGLMACIEVVGSGRCVVIRPIK
jgi:hypothetical protein